MLVTIRPYEDKDADWISTINAQGYEYPEPTDRLMSEIANGRCWVAEQTLSWKDDEHTSTAVVGFIVAKYKNRVPYVHNICIVPYARGKGIGYDLLTVFHNHFAAFDETWLHVAVNNDPAIDLYYKAGYRVGNVDYNYYGPDKPALCMYRPMPK